jgi:hypothetical protein
MSFLRSIRTFTDWLSRPILGSGRVKRIVLFNDTSLLEPHFGPHLVVQTIREQLAKRDIEIIGALHRDALPQDNRQLLTRADLVLINGEGSIHHGRCGHLVEVARDYPAALINCVYQENPPNDALSHFRYIAARESLSARHLIECGARDVEVVPDLMFASSLLTGWVRGEATIDIGLTDNVVNCEAGHKPFVNDPADYLRWLSQHRRIVCGRYHAAVACCVLGIPFSCWPSNTWKIEGMLQDLGLPHLHFKSQQEAVQSCPVSFIPEWKERIDSYVRGAQTKIASLFERLARLAT